ncbi:GlxA family transcriptional regulator [Rhodospirillaceae bacterium KN72]|uniref:GlxA family transcriptional regulator n=1 Tax=Pacificispira spongiicola TaxID=2729598 RepID=A0A7Y0E243_9PROT|nr:GlxA family transcriptional regulator [Pacificispira spongiicola]NMM45810.1 GlxA family transcriptional regulator [Pacificispira spongiicola]
MPTKTIAFIVFSDFQILDLTGPLETFSIANCFGGDYETVMLSTEAGLIQSSNGLSVGPARALADIDPGRFDTILTVGGRGTFNQRGNTALTAWLARAAGRTRRIGSVCTGAFLLAEAGLLAGRRATTHWESAERLARDFPDISVVPDAIFQEDTGIWTSAGVTAGMDMALALIETDHGRDTALATARELVLFLKRPGGQSQFSAELMAQQQAPSRFTELQRWIFDNLNDRLTVENLADRAGMSRRSFQRHFTESFGMTPARFVERARIDAARRDLEAGDGSLDRIAVARGFGDAEHMRRAFLRILHLSPADYRDRFQATRRPAA